MKSRSLRALWIFVLLGIDQYSKILAVSIKSKVLIPSFLNLSLAENPGIIFGFLSDSLHRYQPLVLITIGLITIIYFGYLYFKTNTTHIPIYSLGLILSGSIGNIVDRIRNGYVIDFIDFHYKHWHYWTFNFADSYIVIGLISWLLADITRPKGN